MEFKLAQDEKVIWEAKPLSVYRIYLFITSGVLGFIGLVLFLFYGIYSIIPSTGVVLFFSISTVITVLASIIYVELSYRKEHYWITNKRIIMKRGIIGFYTYSIPLEMISDINTSRNWLEKMLGIGSVYVQSLAGQYSGGGFGAEASFRGIKNPEEIQKIIFDLIKKKKQGSNDERNIPTE